MYNRYIPNGAAYTRVVEEDAPPFPTPDARTAPPPLGESVTQPAPPHPPEQSDPPAPDRRAPSSHETPQPGPPEAETPAEPEKKHGLAGLLKGLKLDDLDTGDILLLLIVLFLFLEGDDMELIITLGLLLILGL